MRNRIKTLFYSALGHKTILKNIGYLSILQGVNLLIPLITLPYLLRVLGGEVYGRVVFAQAIAAYLVILVGFGFNITAVTEVSINRENKEKLSKIVSSVFIIKGSLFLVSLVVLSLIFKVYPPFNDNRILIYLSMWMCLYEFIFPEWYFQGIEKMKFVTVITSVFRLIFLTLIFVLIRDKDDYLLVPIINGIGATVAGGIGLFIIFFSHKIKFKMQDVKTIKRYINDSFPIFIYRSSQLYIKLNKVVIGTFIGMTEVAYYDLAEKIVSVLKMPLTIIGQAVFPRNVKDKNIRFIRKVFLLIISGNALLVLLIILFTNQIVGLIGGNEMIAAVPIVQLLVFTLFPVAFNSLFASQTLFAFGYKKTYMWTIICAGIAYLFFILAMYGFGLWSLLGVGAAVLLAECVTACMSFYYIKKLKIL